MHSEKQPKKIGEVLARPSLSERMAEHRRRMDTDPDYRAEQEAQEKDREEQLQREEEKERERFRISQIILRREKAGIPKRVIEALDALQETAAVAAARQFIQGRETILALAGGEGCGKTVAACDALDRYTATVKKQDKNWGPEMFTGYMVKALELVRAGSFDREFWDGLLAWDLLVIDDIGTEPLDEKGWALANIHNLIDLRYDAARKTIITTNLTLERFSARYCQDGGRLLGRLREVGAFVELTDKSMRKAAEPPPRHWSETDGGEP